MKKHYYFCFVILMFLASSCKKKDDPSASCEIKWGIAGTQPGNAENVNVNQGKLEINVPKKADFVLTPALLNGIQGDFEAIVNFEGRAGGGDFQWSVASSSPNAVGISIALSKKTLIIVSNNNLDFLELDSTKVSQPGTFSIKRQGKVFTANATSSGQTLTFTDELTDANLLLLMYVSYTPASDPAFQIKINDVVIKDLKGAVIFSDSFDCNSVK